MGTIIINFEDRIEVPAVFETLRDFRDWTKSETFPESGRVDFIDGRIEVDMSPEDLFTHGAPKSEVHGVLYSIVKLQGRGMLFVDRTRVVSAVAKLSCEPDIVYVSHDAIRSGRVKLVATAKQEPGRYVELDGGPELVVEIVSDRSQSKDRGRLRQAYYEAGVEEYWLIDVRGDVPELVIHNRGEAGFEPVVYADDGFVRSAVLSCAFRLTRKWNQLQFWDYDLEVG
jgi:Uma2 family endonuclease